MNYANDISSILHFILSATFLHSKQKIGTQTAKRDAIVEIGKEGMDPGRSTVIQFEGIHVLCFHFSISDIPICCKICISKPIFSEYPNEIYLPNTEK